MIRAFAKEIGWRLALGLLLFGIFKLSYGDTTVVLNFSDGSTEVCSTSDPWQLDYTTFVFTGISCRTDKIFAADFEAAGRRESNK